MIIGTLNAQPDSIPSSVHQYFDKKRTDETYSLQLDYSNNWLNYAPSIGVMYDLQGRPRPSFSFNPAQIFVARQNRQRMELEQLRILEQINREEKAEVANLKKVQRQLEHLKKQYQLHEENFNLSKRIFKLQEAKYDDAEISTEEFLKASQSYQNAILRLAEHQQQIFELENEWQYQVERLE